MKKHLSIILALALVFTALAIPGVSADTTVVFSGLPESGTSKTENGVAFSIENKGATSVANNGGSIAITSTGWDQVDSIFNYTVNSSTHKGTVRFEYDFSLAAALGGTLYMRYNDNIVAGSFSASAGAHKMAFVYNAKSGEASVELDGTTSWSGSIDAATGISKVFMRVMGGSGTAEMTLSNASVTYETEKEGSGVYFTGLPKSGTTKTENGVAFSIENKGATSVANNGGSIAITSAGWDQVDSIFNYTVNSSTHKGTVRFEYDFSLAAALAGTLYMRYNENQATNSFSASAGTHKMAFVYNAKSGEASVELDGTTSWSGSIDAATGISKVFMRVMGGSGTAEMTLSNASVIYEETMTGYGTYFSGLPTNSSFSKTVNGVSFNMKKSGNEKAKYSYTEDGGILFETEGYNQVDGVFDYIVNSSTHDGIVGFDFYVKSGNIIPEINVKINNNSYTKTIRNISAGENKISFAYNTKTKEGKVYLNGSGIANTVLDEIQSVTLRLFAPNTTGSFVLSNADVKYVEDVEAIGNLALTKNQDSCTASVIIMNGEYSFLPENMKFAIVSYIGNRVEKIDFKNVLLTPGENRLSGTLSGLTESSNVKAFLWKSDLAPVKFAQ